MRARPRGKSGAEKHFHPETAATPNELPSNTNRLPGANEFKHSIDTLPPMAPSLRITQTSSNSIKWRQQTFLNLKLHPVFSLLSFLPWSSSQTVPTDSHNFFQNRILLSVFSPHSCSALHHQLWHAVACWWKDRKRRRPNKKSFLFWPEIVKVREHSGTA